MNVLTDIVVLLAVSLVAMFFAHKAKVPMIVGILVAGAIAGPNGLRLVTAAEEVHSLAQIGIILLLFVIGLELSLEELGPAKRSLLAAGALQIVLTTGVGMLVATLAGISASASLLIGFVLASSSTAVALKLLQERAEHHAPHGRFALGISIVQDIASVPILLLMPLLAGQGAVSLTGLLRPFAGGVVLTALVIVLSRRVIPRVLAKMAQTRSSELFMIAVLGLCLAIAWLSSLLGLSLALGAFLAGLAVSGTEYRHRAVSMISPMRDVFTGFFFVAMGMLIDLRVIWEQPVFVAALVAAVVVVKLVIVVAIILLLRHPFRTAWLSGVLLAQVGEFGFVVTQAAVESKLFTLDYSQTILTVSAISMAVVPALFLIAPSLSDALSSRKKSDRGKAKKTPSQADHFADHLIIVGYGLNGRNLSSACRIQGSQYVVVEGNPLNVQEAREKGDPIILGDATSEATLLEAGVDRARTLVVAISDARATRRVVALARQMSPRVHIIVRTRFVSELEGLQKLGADQVVPEEFETAIEIFVRVMRRQNLPEGNIERLVSAIRSGSYEAFRETTESSSRSD